jgi:hypothetical protein
VTLSSGNLETLQLPEKTGFPIKDFGNDSQKKTFYEAGNAGRPKKQRGIVPSAYFT